MLISLSASLHPAMKNIVAKIKRGMTRFIVFKNRFAIIRFFAQIVVFLRPKLKQLWQN